MLNTLNLQIFTEAKKRLTKGEKLKSRTHENSNKPDSKDMPSNKDK